MLILACLLVMSACGTAQRGTDEQASDPSAGQTAAEQQTGSNQNTPAQQEQNVTETIKGYYTDPDLTQLIEKEVEITYPKEDGGKKYLAALEALGTAPDSDVKPLLKDWAFNGAALTEDGTLNVDISGKNDYNYGSTGEDFSIKAITRTLFQFEEVKKIQLLVDGQIVESLMGHIDINQPFEREG